MSIDRRNFLKSATMTTLSAGLALGSAHLIFGQQPSRGDRRSATLGTGGSSDSEFQVPIQAQQDSLFFFRSSTKTHSSDFVYMSPRRMNAPNTALQGRIWASGSSFDE